ncbi:hypothetical protein H4R99_005326 [Coemansia sp. RSA 1722]|nr:hypothetical protein H4R99_005326 [Coemansia sp. RSA 1722]
MTLQSRTDLESLYGSSFYGGNFADDKDLPEYAQLCRRLFPTLLSLDDHDTDGPETEEALARYFKYLTSLPLSSLKMEPALLKGDLQRISNELTTLLLKESFRPAAAKENKFDSGSDALVLSPGAADDGSGVLSSQDGLDDTARSAFGAVSAMNKAAVSAADKLGSGLVETQEILGRLETVCGQFANEMAELDQRAKLIHQVLDKQDLVTRIVELPRVMQMCVAGGYYEEAVEIAEHVRHTGDRLIRDISEAVQTLPGSKEESRITPGSRDQLISFVGTIQKQVQSEYEAMVLGLCRELSYTRLGALTSVQSSHERRQLGISGLGETLGDSNGSNSSSTVLKGLGSIGISSGYDGSVKRMSQMAKIVSILRSVGIFAEEELRMLYLRSRWSAWLATEESLSGFAPVVVSVNSAKSQGGSPVFDGSLTDTPKTLMSIAPSVFQSPTAKSPSASGVRQSPEKSSSSAEVCAYLVKYIDSFFLWLAEVDMQYETLFSAKTSTNNVLAANTDTGADPFADLALYSSQKFVGAVTPLLSELTDASGISSLESLVSTHARTLARRGIDFAVPFIVRLLHERAFVSVASGIEQAVASACESILAMESAEPRDAAVGSVSDGSIVAEQKWEQLVVPTRPTLDLDVAFSTEISNNPSKFLGQHRVSPIGLLQYPLLSQLLHTFRDSLHSLRILVLAGDSADSDEAPVLLSMASVVLESELIKLGECIAALCQKVESVDSDRIDSRSSRAVRDVSVAFVFGLVRHVAEVFEEIASLNEPASFADIGMAGGDLAAALYSADIYRPLLGFIQRR